MSKDTEKVTNVKPFNRTIFRRKAWEAYVEKRERTVLPRLVAPPVFVFFWILFALLLSAGGIAWWDEVPIYTAGSGILLEQPASSLSEAHEMMALIFLPTSRLLPLQRGVSIQLQAEKIGPGGSGQIERVEPGLTSPQDARKRYMLDGALALLITRPSMVVFVSVQPPLSSPMYTGSVVSAQIPIGTQRLLTLLLGSGN